MKQRFSFVIPTRNEEKYITRCLESIKFNMQKLNHDNFEIIIFDNFSSDRTVSIIEENYPDVTLIKADHKMYVSKSRNIAVNSATGDILFFIDGDVVLAHNWYSQLEYILEVLNKNPNTIMGAPYGFDRNSSWVTKHWYAKELTAGSKYIPAGHMIMTKKTFSTLDGFDNELETGEDVELCARAKARGGKVIIWPDLETYHLGYPNDLKNFFNRERWHGKGNWFPFKKIGHTQMSQLLVVSLLFYPLGIIAACWNPWLALWGPTATLTGGLVLGLRKIKYKYTKYLASCVALSTIQLLARYLSLVDVLLTKDSYLLRKGG